jgi:hypothetical protein
MCIYCTSQLMCFFHNLVISKMVLPNADYMKFFHRSVNIVQPSVHTKAFLLVYIFKCYLIILSFAIFLFRNFRLITFVEYIYENCLTKPAFIYLDIDLSDKMEK